MVAMTPLILVVRIPLEAVISFELIMLEEEVIPFTEEVRELIAEVREF